MICRILEYEEKVTLLKSLSGAWAELDIDGDEIVKSRTISDNRYEL